MLVLVVQKHFFIVSIPLTGGVVEVEVEVVVIVVIYGLNSFNKLMYIREAFKRKNDETYGIFYRVVS